MKIAFISSFLNQCIMDWLLQNTVNTKIIKKKNKTKQTSDQEKWQVFMNS